MDKTYIIIDMQNDFITGSLRNEAAQKIVPGIVDLLDSVAAENASSEESHIIATMDTHDTDYLDTNEGKYLPIKHCIKYTDGWLIQKDIMATINSKFASCSDIIEKSTFGFRYWDDHINAYSEEDEIYLVGTCTDICVLSNALILKATFPRAKVIVYEDLCAGLTKEAHDAAITVMKNCQVEVRTWKK